MPGTRISSSSTSRVTPGRQPELSGGVHTWLPLAMKMLADVHSATSPRSLSRITSSKPRCWAFSSQVRFIAQERILAPANSQAAWRACGLYASLTPWPHSLVSAVSAITSLARPFEGPGPHAAAVAHDRHAEGGIVGVVGFHQFEQPAAQRLGSFGAAAREQRGVALDAGPVALEGEEHPIGNAQRAENAPARQQADLPRRQRFGRCFLNAIVVKNKPVQHVPILSRGGSAPRSASARQLGCAT